MTTDQQKMLCSSLTGSAAKILIAFFLAGQELDVKEIREWTGLKRETIYDGLAVLKIRAIVENKSLAHGREVWSLSSALPALQMSEKRIPEVQMSKFRTPTLEEEVSIKNLNLIESTSSNTITIQMSEKRTPGNDGYPSIQRILDATNILFGLPGVVSSGLDLDLLEPWTVLGWIGFAWDQWREGGKNGNLFAPAGVIYNKLIDPGKPHAGRGFHEGAWRKILPAEFLEALDLAQYSCEDCDQIFTKSSQFEAHREKEHPQDVVIEAQEINIEGDETIKAIISNTTMTAESLWQNVLDQFEIDMPKASFDTWMRNTGVIHFSENILIIGTQNAYAQDWLTSRVKLEVEKRISKMTPGKIIQVIFKVIGG